jgi:hypothetical protein
MLNLKLIVFLHAITAGSLQQSNCTITASEFMLSISSVSSINVLFHCNKHIYNLYNSATRQERSEIPTGWCLVIDAATGLAGGTRSVWSHQSNE